MYVEAAFLTLVASLLSLYHYLLFSSISSEMVALLFKSLCRCNCLTLSLNARHLSYFADLVSYCSTLSEMRPYIGLRSAVSGCAAMPLNGMRPYVGVRSAVSGLRCNAPE